MSRMRMLFPEVQMRMHLSLSMTRKVSQVHRQTDRQTAVRPTGLSDPSHGCPLFEQFEDSLTRAQCVKVALSDRIQTKRTHGKQHEPRLGKMPYTTSIFNTVS